LVAFGKQLSPLLMMMVCTTLYTYTGQAPMCIALCVYMCRFVGRWFCASAGKTVHNKLIRVFEVIRTRLKQWGLEKVKRTH